LFVFDDDELATVQADAPRPDDDTLLRIARACPNGAIHVARDGVEIAI
jgi:ferredoxin